MPSGIYEPWDVIVIPFPFTDRPGKRRRPALILSRRAFNENGYTILAMITTKTQPQWPGDTLIKDQKEAGLRSSCIVRLKLFTLDNRLIVKKIGSLSEPDRFKLEESLRTYLF